MKKTAVCTIILLLSMFVSLQSHAIIPPGTTKVKLNNSIYYVDNNETSNFDWSFYTGWKKQKDSIGTSEYNALLVDSAIWKKEYGAMDKKQARNLPVIGVTRQQAEEYCTWRSDVVNMHPKFQKSGKKVSYTLLSEEQYEALSKNKKWAKKAINSNPFPFKGFRCIAVMTNL